VLLDELGEIPLAVQVKLLRAIETRRVLRVGGRVERPLDVRFVSATSADLEAAIAHKTFRADLYYRLAGYEVRVPPLRARREEIVPLAERFLAEVAREDAPIPRLSDEAREALEHHGWPGNVRELRNAMERAALLCTDGVIDRRALPFAIAATAKPTAAVPTRPTPASPTLASPTLASPTRPEPEPGDPASTHERARIETALARCAGNQTQAALLLGISRRTLVTRLSRYALPRPRKRP
jgi:DNA-binding NtrC family response regulator